MTASNHVITGALIGAVIGNPVAIPVAFLAHFALDALPHFGLDEHTDRKFLLVLSADAGLASALLLVIAVLQPANWPLIFMCGIACASPDLMWFPRWVREIRGKKPKPLSLIARFHARIQWAERQRWWGVLCEVMWFSTMFVLLGRSLSP